MHKTVTSHHSITHLPIADHLLKSFYNGLIIEIFLVCVGILLLYYVERKVYNHLYRKFKSKKRMWGNALLDAIHRPLTILISVLGLSAIFQLLSSAINKHSALSTGIALLSKISIIGLLAWSLLRFISSLERNWIYIRLKQHKPVDQTTLHAIVQIASATIIVFVALMFLDTLGVSLSGVLAFGGIGGIVIGFAAKDTLANFFGGLMIYFDRPFAVGDWIRCPENHIEGHVEHIGWRLCKIRTLDHRPLYISNAVFSTIAVENPSRMTHRRILFTVSVRYADVAAVPAILNDIRVSIQQNVNIDQAEDIAVNLVELGASSLNMLVDAFTHKTDKLEFYQVRQEIFLMALNTVARHGAECAFPSTTLYVPDQVQIRSDIHKKVTAPLAF